MTIFFKSFKHVFSVFFLKLKTFVSFCASESEILTENYILTTFMKKDNYTGKICIFFGCL